MMAQKYDVIVLGSDAAGQTVASTINIFALARRLNLTSADLKKLSAPTRRLSPISDTCWDKCREPLNSLPRIFYA
jgi:hypothetical protein